MRKLTVFAVAALLLAAACAKQPPPEKAWDKEGVRQRAGETGKKLEKEEQR
ncbi:MAG: hypothetical protein HZA03_09600 [Nitrospinae bacterium]|nr:hypothetical protein [Nitrospinota bacterium]